MNDLVVGNFNLDLNGLVRRVSMFFVKEIYVNINILIRLLVLSILCALLKNLRSAFESKGVAEIAFFASYIVVISILILSFNEVLNLTRSLIEDIATFMFAVIPVLISLILSTGNIISGTLFKPITILIIQVSITLIKNILLPLIMFSTILSILDNISDNIKVSKLATLLKQISLWGVGIILTVFIAMISVQGTVGAVVDGVTSKTTKFAIGSIIPVAGKYLADAADTVIGCTLLIKNAAGVVVMIGVISICMIPMLKILALIALYRITCVLVEPLGEGRLTNAIHEVANSLTIVFGIVASVACMFLVTVTIVVGSSNISSMIR